jgi:hypothetical protein
MHDLNASIAAHPAGKRRLSMVPTIASVPAIFVIVTMARVAHDERGIPWASFDVITGRPIVWIAR